MRKFLAIGLASLSFILYYGSAFAHYNPGFNCRTVHGPAEMAVCKSRSLSRLDRVLNHWYQRAKERARYFDQVSWLHRKQMVWIRSRNACGGNRLCLRLKYRQRIRELRNYTLHV